MKHLAKLAMSADRVIQRVADQFNGNAARRQALHRRAGEIANEIRRQRWARNHAKANQRLGLVPQGHRMMLNMTAQYYRYAA